MPMRFLFCVSCSVEFAFTEAEQKYYLEREYTEPKRCPKCRKIKKANKERGNDFNNRNNNSGRAYRTKCFSCGTETVVNFRPTYLNPAFCKGCDQGRYKKRRYQASR